MQRINDFSVTMSREFSSTGAHLTTAGVKVDASGLYRQQQNGWA